MTDIESVFEPGGLLDSELPSYVYRSGQVEMASLIDKAIKEKRHAEVEAGTGTGKSFAYLVPVVSMLNSDKSKRAIIATSTIALQKQLFDKDIPIIEKALSSDIEVTILFGRSNYLCIRRFSEARNEKGLLKEVRTPEEIRFEEWVASTDTGDASSVPSASVGKMFYQYASDEKDCLMHRCPYIEECFYYNARRRAQKSNLIVTNHHLLLIDAKARYDDEIEYSDDAILPSYSVCVVDEAHHIRNQSAIRHQVVKKFCDTAEAVVFLTATPIQLGNEDLYSLLNLLRPDIIVDEETFNTLHAPNKYITQAVQNIRNKNLAGAIENLHSAANSVGGKFVSERPDFKESLQILQKPVLYTTT